MVVFKVFSTCKTIFKVDIESQILPELISLWCLYYNIWTRFYLLLCTWRVRSSCLEEFYENSILRGCLHKKKRPTYGPVKRVPRLAGKISVFVYMRIFVPVRRDENVTWYYFDFWAWKKVNMAIRNVVLLLSLNLTALFSLILQLHGIIILWKIDEKRLQDLATAMNLRKRNIYMRKLRRIKQRRLFCKKRSCWNTPGRTEEWWLKMINGESPPGRWKKNFRTSRDLLMSALDELWTFLRPKPNSPNHRALSAEKKRAMTLYYLKDTGSLSMTANSFGVAICTVSSVI